jgi:hypothetical protein
MRIFCRVVDRGGWSALPHEGAAEGKGVWEFSLGLRSLSSLTLGCHRSPRLGFLRGGPFSWRSHGGK